MVRRDDQLSRAIVILACREGRCGWDFAGSPFYVTNTRLGRRVWERLATCLRDCGSTKRTRVKPDGSFQEIGSPKITRPPDWDDYKDYAYFSSARRELIMRQGPVESWNVVLPMAKNAEAS